MSILTEKLQNAIIYENKKYYINTDFRVWLKFNEIVQNSQDLFSQCEQIIKLCFLPGELPPLEASIAGLFDFYFATDDEQNKSKKNEKKSTPIFSFSKDAKYIFAAFLEVYGIDLIEIPYLHWHKFCALLWALPEETNFMKIVSYRSVDVSKIKDKEKKRLYERLKNAYALSDTRTDEEKEKDFADAISKL